MVHSDQAQPVFALQGELPNWLQLESQVQDGLPVPSTMGFSGGGRRVAVGQGPPA